MTEPLISVIIPVYNVAQYVKEAIDSVINQTYKKLEIIVIDDGSTDESGKICDSYAADPRVKVIHQKNKGLSGARNTGLDVMTGDVVAFLDSDDYYYPNMLEIMAAEMIRSDADIVICDFMWDDTACKLERKSYNAEAALKELVKGKMELAVWNKIYKKHIWDGIRFPEGHTYEGTRTTHKLLEKADRIEQLPDCLMFHRTRKGSIVQTTSPKSSMEFFRACREFEGYVIRNTPGAFSEEELERLLEWRFGMKVQHWMVIYKADLARAMKIRRWMLGEIRSTKTWGWKSSIKLGLFRVWPGGLAKLLRIKRVMKR